MNKVIAKYIDVQVEFQTPCLADFWPGPPKDMYTFFRDEDDCVVLRHRHLFAMLTKAKALISSNIDIRKVDFVTSIVAATEPVLVKYEDGGQAKHEAIIQGQQVWFSFGLESDVKYEDFMALMTTAGKDIGLSPARSSENYGRFTVLTGEEQWLQDSTPIQS